MARRKAKGRPVDGILLLDKALGYTSNKALQAAKRLYFAQKAGHTGSLDPLATGMLPLCFGEATKVCGFLLEADKEYTVTAKLGERSDTGDAEGDIIETRPVPALDDAEVAALLARFRGPIEQIPPMYSALKRDGQPLYKLARQGVEVEREPRGVTIHELECTGRSDDTLELRVRCSKGTYIRTLVEDIGERIGCGAHVTALRRTLVEPFAGQSMVSVDNLRDLAKEGGDAAIDALLLPVDAALAAWPAVSISKPLAEYIVQGQAIRLRDCPDAELLRLYREDGRFLGMGRMLEDGRIAAKRLMAGVLD
jgi:tRNA pseudouridine55 synthase